MVIHLLFEVSVLVLIGVDGRLGGYNFDRTIIAVYFAFEACVLLLCEQGLGL